MIEFGRSKDTLKALASKDHVVLEDVLGVFLDLCEDVKSSGCSVDGLDVEEQDKLLTNLSRSGRLFLKIIKKKSDQINAADAAERMKRQEEQITSQMGELEEKEKTLSAAKKQLDEKIVFWEAKKKQCEQQMDEVNKKHQYYQKLSSECERMQSLINEMDHVSIGPMEVEVSNLGDALEKRKQSMQQLEVTLAKLRKEYEEQSKVYTQKISEQEKLHQDIRTVDSVIDSQNKSIAKLVDEESEKRATVQELQNRQNQLHNDVITLQNEIDRLREHLANSDLEHLQKEKEHLLKEKMDLDESVAKELTECETLRLSLQECQDERMARKAHFEKEQSRISDENTLLMHQIDELVALISNEEKEKEALEKALNDAENRYKQLRKWFESLEVSQYDERLKTALQKTSLFEEAQKALFYEIGEIGLTQTISMQEANEKKEELKKQLRDIETSMSSYQRKYQIICKLLSD